MDPKAADEVDNPKFEIEFYEGVIRQTPNYIEALFPLAEAYTRAGEYRKGLEIDKKLSVLLRDDPTVHYNLACSYALVGEKENALEMLEKAVGMGYCDGLHMKKDPDLKSLHKEPAFQKLLKRLNGI